MCSTLKPCGVNGEFSYYFLEDGNCILSLVHLLTENINAEKKKKPENPEKAKKKKKNDVFKKMSHTKA